jgi:murein DD-endopeptidase MepM/ murein hydrolase activator NlpD
MALRGYTFVVHLDGALESRQVRLPGWLARSLLIAAIAVGVAVIIAAASWGPILVAAGRVPLLEREVRRLRGENARVGELARALDEAEARYAHLRVMLGADTKPQAGSAAATTGEERLFVAPPLLARAPAAPDSLAEEETEPAVPYRWPLRTPSYRTRGLAAGGTVEEHGGIDLAVPIGSEVRAAAAGVVRTAGEDPAYGLFVLLDHAGGYQSMYGHLSRLVVVTGQQVGAGQVIGLSGSTGRSTAPHLHFEIRRHGRSVDPTSLVREGVG